VLIECLDLAQQRKFRQHKEKEEIKEELMQQEKFKDLFERPLLDV
jgi:hypothetical protein